MTETAMGGPIFVVRASRSRGGFATTFNARGPTGEVLLVKVANDTSDEAVSTLRREYQLQRRLSALDGRFARPVGFVERVSASGPDRGWAEGKAALLSERIFGPSLRDLIDSGRYLEDEAGRRVARDLLEQEAVLADLGYCHHDVTPSNVMLDIFRAEARLIDLGVASRLDADDGVRVRGPYQRPDELARARGVPPSRLTDLYATALILREACWGDLMSSGRAIPDTHLGRWVRRVLADGFHDLAEALHAL